MLYGRDFFAILTVNRKISFFQKFSVNILAVKHTFYVELRTNSTLNYIGFPESQITVRLLEPGHPEQN